MFARKFAGGGDLCKEHLLGLPDSFGTSLPIATLELAFDEEGPAQNRRRNASTSPCQNIGKNLVL
jgi:alpha-L-fucosidase 2